MNRDEISILIVDDEPEARDLLSMLIAQINNVKVIGEADSTNDALELVLRYNPDLIFLDIQMPEKSGFELINELRTRNINPDYIFVTAYDQYAIRAIKASALDYLLKPVDINEISEAICRFRHKRDKNNLDDRLNKLLNKVGIGKKLKFNTRAGYILIDSSEIIYCLADGNYTEIYMTSGRKETITCTLGSVVKDLSGYCFLRISRSAIINLNYLTYVDNKGGKCRLFADSAITLKVSRSRLSELKNFT